MTSPSDTAPAIIVSGLPRSGTSLAMMMLEAAGIPVFQDGQRTADDDNPKGYYEHDRVKVLGKEKDTAWLHESRGQAIKIISFLLREVPEDLDCRIVFMHRRIEEVLASQAKMLERRGEASKVNDAQMTAVYRKHLETVQKLIESRPTMQCLELQYHEVVANPAPEAARIAEFLELPEGSTEKMAQRVDPDLYRNRK
ncbi:MAG: sulfotransferase [Planctomycetota bacterium]